MPYVNLPPGNAQLAFADGGPVARRENGRAWVSDERARMINSMRGNGDGGLLNATNKEYGVAGGSGRTCCGRLWYKFTIVCPSCGSETIPAEATAATASDQGGPEDTPGDMQDLS